jgi:type IV secretory pathway TraG/TraD family ATPase VirD4
LPSDHWQTAAHSLLTGAILHVLYAEEDKTLAGVGRFLVNPSATQVQTLERMLENARTPDGPHPAVTQAAREMMNKIDNELSGVFVHRHGLPRLLRARTRRQSTGSRLLLSNRTESEQEFGRPLLTPAGVTQLPQDDGLLLVGGLLPYRTPQVRHFLDPRFQGRDQLPPPDALEEQARERLPSRQRLGGLIAAGAPRHPPGPAPFLPPTILSRRLKNATRARIEAFPNAADSAQEQRSTTTTV